MGVTTRSHTHRLQGVRHGQWIRRISLLLWGAHRGVSLCWYACTVLYVAVVCANPAVESPGSCREGAGSIPAVRVAALPKR